MVQHAVSAWQDGSTAFGLLPKEAASLLKRILQPFAQTAATLQHETKGQSDQLTFILLQGL